MRRVKAALCALLALCLACLCACSQRPEQSLAAAQKKLAETESFSYVIMMDMGMSYAGESFNITSVCQVDYTSEPAAVRLQLSTEMGRLGTVAYTAYAVPSDGAYSAYIELPGMWVRQDLSGVEALEQYDIRLASGRWISGLSGASEAGAAEVGGQKARCYSCTVSAAAVDEIMDSTGAYEPLSMLGIDGDRAREMVAGLGEIPMSVWLGAQGLPLRYKLDLTDIMSALMDSISGETNGDYAVMTIDSLTVSVILDSFDAVEAITVPPEALDARPLEGEELF